MERIKQIEERMSRASRLIGPTYGKILELRQTGIVKRSDLRLLDNNLHDIVGALGSVLNSVHFLKRDFEKARVYRIVVDNQDEFFDQHVDDDGNPLTLETARVIAARHEFSRVETQIATPWEKVEDEALDR